MSDAEAEPRGRLLNLIFAALDVGIKTVQATNGGMHPFLMTQGDGKPAYTRFVADSMQQSIESAQEAVGQLPAEVPAYAIAIDGYVTVDKEKFDAVIVEAAERWQPSGFVFAQRYRPAQDERPFEVVGRPTLINEVPSRFAVGCCVVFFRSGACDIKAASRALTRFGLTVKRDGDQLTVFRRDSPKFRVRLAVGDWVRKEAEAIGEGTEHAAALGQCDARFEAAFDSLDEVQDEINTLMEVQWALQKATKGFLFLPWHGDLSEPSQE